jgi:SAM-dependent methyltransferase
MALSSELKGLACRLGTCAEFARSNAARDLERSVYGCDYGGTSGTTQAEAERIAPLLDVRRGARLLDVGAGTGWPGLYLAQLTGCDAVLVDLPLASLRIARERGAADGLAQRCEVVVADGAALPFRDGFFDALSHSDVLCCTPDKLGVLRACRRVVRDGAMMVFTVIALAPSLSEVQRGHAKESAPAFIDVDEDYAILLDRSRWRLQERSDLTTAFAQSMRAELDGMRARADALADVYGASEFEERVQRQQGAVADIDAGLVRRELFVARAG